MCRMDCLWCRRSPRCSPRSPPPSPPNPRAVPTSGPTNKWDGFRAIVFRDGDEVVLGSRGGKDLVRYFPELADAARAELPRRCVVDGRSSSRANTTAAPDSTGRRCPNGSTRPPAGSRCSPSRHRPCSSASICSLSATRTSWRLRSPSGARGCDPRSAGVRAATSRWPRPTPIPPADGSRSSKAPASTV